MGKFVKSADLKVLSNLPQITALTPDQIELQLIRPAERAIELEFALDLETSRVPPLEDARDVPSQWRSTFDAYPEEETKFRDDMRDAVLLMATRLATNPHELSSASVGGSSSSFGPRLPTDVRNIMSRWAGKRQVVR